VQEDKGTYPLAPGLHVVTVFGYDDGGIHVSKPVRGNIAYHGRDDFLGTGLHLYSIQDHPGVAPCFISPSCSSCVRPATPFMRTARF